MRACCTVFFVLNGLNFFLVPWIDLHQEIGGRSEFTQSGWQIVCGTYQTTSAYQLDKASGGLDPDRYVQALGEAPLMHGYWIVMLLAAILGATVRKKVIWHACLGGLAIVATGILFIQMLEQFPLQQSVAFGNRRVINPSMTIGCGPGLIIAMMLMSGVVGLVLFDFIKVNRSGGVARQQNTAGLADA